MSAESPTFHQLHEQHDKGKSPTVLVRRSDGNTITTGVYEGQKPGDSRYIVAVDGGKGERYVSAEALTDAHQAELAEQLAGQPLKNELGEAALTLAGQGENPAFIDKVPDHILAQAAPATEAAPHLTPEEQADSLSAQIDALVANLNEDDKNALFRYSTYASDKKTSQLNSDGEGSMRAGQYMGQELRGMSEQAQRVADQYHRMMTQLSRLRNLE